MSPKPCIIHFQVPAKPGEELILSTPFIPKGEDKKSLAVKLPPEMEALLSKRKNAWSTACGKPFTSQEDGFTIYVPHVSCQECVDTPEYKTAWMAHMKDNGKI